MMPRLLFLILGGLVVVSSVPDAQQNPLVGTWEEIDGRVGAEGNVAPTRPNMLIFGADGYYMSSALPPNRPRVNKPLSEMTKEELVARFTEVRVQRGVYQVSGDRVTTQRLASADPNEESRRIVRVFRIEGDVMTLSAPDPAVKLQSRFRRLKPGAPIANGRAALTEPVSTDKGLIRGTPGRDSSVQAFKGIPFAAPPVGALRWQGPQPVSAWEGVRSADRFGPRCMQPRPDTGIAQDSEGLGQPMAEDCLYLNVWTAATAASARQPVIVWAHGGSFIVGAGSWPEFDGEALARKGVVVVTLNYRLGPFGFFAHPDLTRESGRNASGNYGVMDFVAGLEWVRRNIAAFGGDPERVTAVGQSAGGYLVHYAIASARVPRLFQRAIIQSAPTRLEQGLTLRAAEAVGHAAAEKVGARSLAALRGLSAAQVLDSLPPLRPIVDGWIRTEDMWSSARAGRLKRVDLLIGSNEDEGTFPYLRARDVGLGPMSADEFVTFVRERFGPQADTFLSLYPARNEEEKAASQLAAFTDEAAWHARFFASAETRVGAKAYLYSFDHEPPVAAGATNRRATHTAEIPYMFNNPQPLWGDVDRRLADTMSSYWVNFARTGDPNGPELPRWPQFVPGSGERLLRLGSRVEAGPTLDAARVRLFDGLLQRLTPGSEGGRP